MRVPINDYSRPADIRRRLLDSCAAAPHTLEIASRASDNPDSGPAGVSDPVRLASAAHSIVALKPPTASCMSLAIPASASMAETASPHFSLNDLSI